MGALEQVFGAGVKLDAEGKPIERGFGNLHDRQKSAVVSAPASVPSSVPSIPVSAPSVAKPVSTDHLKLIADAQQTAANIVADAKTEAEKLLASVHKTAAPAVAATPVPITPTAPVASVIPVPATPDLAAVAPAKPTLFDRLKTALEHGETNIEAEIAALVKDL